MGQVVTSRDDSQRLQQSAGMGQVSRSGKWTKKGQVRGRMVTNDGTREGAGSSQMAVYAQVPRCEVRGIGRIRQREVPAGQREKTNSTNYFERRRKHCDNTESLVVV